jgi:hypothetical protein
MATSLEDLFKDDVPEKTAPSKSMSLEDLFSSEVEDVAKPKPTKKQLTLPEKAASSLISGAVRAGALPADILTGAVQLPGLLAKGADWLLGNEGPSYGTNEKDSFAIAPRVTKALHPFTYEGMMSEVRKKLPDLTQPYEASGPLPALAQAVAERGPSSLVGGAAFGIPKTINYATSVVAPGKLRIGCLGKGRPGN